MANQQVVDSHPKDAREHGSTDPLLPNVRDAAVEDTAGSSDDEDYETIVHSADDTASVIGVSISQAQSHLKSPNTPAIEKMAAIGRRGGFFDDQFDVSESPENEEQQELQGTDSTRQESAITATEKTAPSKQESPKSPPPTLPTPWRAGPKTFERPAETSGILGSAFRKRSSSGPEKKAKFPLQLPSLPKPPRLFGSSHEDSAKSGGRQRTNPEPNSPQFDGAAWTRDSWNQFVAKARGLSILNEKPPENSWALSPTQGSSHPVPSQQGQESSTPTEAASRPSMGLRRATSDQSLYLARSLSKASSLGDDTRFEHIHEQVNSRLKAIRDSWQDSNLRRNLPTLPKPPLGFSSSRTDLGSQQEGSRSSNSWMRLNLLPSPYDSTRDLHTSFEKHDAHKPSLIPSKSPKIAGMSSANAAAHPNFTEALCNLTGDIVVLGGYRGSILREAHPPHRRLWVPLKVGFNLRKVDLEVGFDDEDEEQVTKKIIPDGMLTHIGPVDISRRLLKRLRASENTQKGSLRVHNYGYDWRLSPHRLSKQFIEFLETLPCNSPGTPPEKRGATVIAHSFGGLMTRHAVNARPELFNGVVYAGVPETCVNILGPLRNGDDVLFSSKVLTAQVNLSIRTSIALLPLYGRCFVDKDTKEEYLVDFYDVNDWIKYRWSPCIDPPLPALSTSGRSSSLISSVSSVIPDSLTTVIPSLPFRNRRDSTTNRGNNPSVRDASNSANTQTKTHQADLHAEGLPKAGMAPQMGAHGKQEPTQAATGVTISREKAIEYLTRVLPRIKRFREELAHNPSHQEKNMYPPFAVIYGKTEPTVCGARVRGRDGIARADAYDDLVFASGDGVVLARAAQLPDGYRAAKGGVIASERGHVTLLGDLEAIGKCLKALHKARSKGVGLGSLEPVNSDQA
ncbi:uncharacterized protein PV09_03975 [Verruconis gallopava]|uniref:Uncharacterized protein n=1 Tax=Verruconis gallopava TaxID=253628 RepID=A0A0D1YVR0_9PEZI|nr:uncharacterized protein PV09_03975 [Verruconis gallopava]KIW04787.1 hypothetical protein PV09_03975 [Verruconis gallopava]